MLFSPKNRGNAAMKNDSDTSRFLREACLSEEDLYGYISGQGQPDRLKGSEAHLAKCPDCRKELAGLMKLLDPDIHLTGEEIPQPGRKEIAQTLKMIRNVARRERGEAPKFRSPFLLPIAAAAAIGFVAISLLGFKYFYEKNKSDAFYAQAKSVLEQSYIGASPSNLRLALPFHSQSSNRNIPGNDSLRSAENLFCQALAVREGMVEAYLGLAYIYLNTDKLELALDEFQKVLNVHGGNVQALIGRGVVQYEQAVQSLDAAARINLLGKALSDFDAALKLSPDSAEALYDKVWVLFENGQHREALKAMDIYLSHDNKSIWAEELKRLKIKMEATQLEAVQEAVGQAASLKDRAFLEEMAGQAPYQVPAVIWSAMRQSLRLETGLVAAGNPTSDDLRWAAGIMEEAYSAATGDHSFKALLKFYAGLSPPQRELKRNLDRKFQDLTTLDYNSKLSDIMQTGKLLEYQYSQLADLWQLANLHHLFGNALYMGKADFSGACSEYLKMHDLAAQLSSPNLMGRAFGSLAMIYSAQGKFEDSLRYANEIESLAKTYNMESYQAYAYMMMGDRHQALGQFEQSLEEYTRALGFTSRLLIKSWLVETLESVGVVLDRLNRTEEAKSFFRQALLRQDEYSKDQTGESQAEITRRRLTLIYKQGELALRTHDLASAEAMFGEALNSGPLGMRELDALSRLGLAEVYLRENRMQEAESMVEGSLSVGVSGHYAEVEWQARSIKGEILESKGDYQRAISSFKQAIEVLEKMRGGIEPSNRQAFLTNRFDPYKSLVSLLHHTADNDRTLLEYIDKAKSITLKEQLQLLQPAVERGEHIRNQSAKYEILPIIEYFFTRDGLLISSTQGGKTEVFSTNLTAENLSREILEYTDSIRSNDEKKFTGLARRLYGELIAPVEKYALAGGSDVLVILPDGPLHLLPFAGLEDEYGRFLIEKKAVVFAPSRTVFNHCISSRSEASSGHNPDVLLIDGSTNLPNAREEVAHLADLYGRSATLLRPKDLQAFGQAATRSEIIHFAGHAVTRFGKSALVLRTVPDEIYLDTGSISSWKLPKTQLVNLAGCSTAIGPIGEGEAPWGLVPAFLNAGAHAIIASLTPVDDASTKLLTYRFYDQLGKGIGKAKALQTAQLELLNSARSGENIRPQSWIPYILIGNPQ
jgi:CHAT domain-containing protein